MLTIYICEDQFEHLKQISNYVKKVLIIEDLDISIALETNNPYQLLEHVKQSNDTGLYLLDIDLQSDINGLELAEQIRLIDPRCFIVFVTAHPEMSILTFQYKVEALDFIIKNTPEQIHSQIHSCIQKAYERYSSSSPLNKVFSFQIGTRKTTIPYSEILFFETSSVLHRLILHTYQKTIEFPGHLNEIERKLDKNFFRCHRSYIINMTKIQEINWKKNLVIMNDGSTCYLSLRRKTALKKQLLRLY